MAKSIALALAAAVAALTAPAQAAYCGGHPNPNAQPNLFPIFSAAPTETRTAPNGRAFRAGAPGYDFWVIHVFGTAYEVRRRSRAVSGVFGRQCGRARARIWKARRRAPRTGAAGTGCGGEWTRSEGWG